MNIQIRDLSKRDYNKARRYAIIGMSLHRYAEKKWELYFYSKYFLYMELLRATQILGAYMGDELVGVLFADINGKPKKVKSVRYRIFNGFVRAVMNLVYRDANSYEEANRAMLDRLKARATPDGELIFFAVNPQIKGKGIGSLLLGELERRESGKLIYLYSDDGCTYQFYDKRGFTKQETQNVTLEIRGKTQELTCMLYSKELGAV